MSRSHHQPAHAAARSASSSDAGARATSQANSPAPTTDRSCDPSNTTTTKPAATSADPSVPFGVGIDTSRYGHYATFLRVDLQPAAADLKFVESAQGYQQLRQRLDVIAQKNGGCVHFHIRLDLAGRYADNLLAFLHTLPHTTTISCGDPQRNKNYRVAIFGHKKSDPVESAACARYALTEKPKPTAALTPPQRLLCQIASRLESQARQGTRVINQLHNLLSRTFPELALLVSDLSAGWVLALLDRYPTAAKLAGTHTSSLEKIPYLPHQHIATLLQHARVSVASLTGPAAEELVRELVGQAKDAHVRQQSLERLLVTAYRQLPQPNHLDSIKGFGAVTAAILTAKIVDPHRFVDPGKLVGHFGIFPVEASSGIDRDGNPRVPIRMIMSKRGNDLVRRYLWMAALSAAQYNPAVKPLYQRVRAKHPDQPSIAIGHVMRKLLHIALAVWKSGQPFNPEHYPWDKPAHLRPEGRSALRRGSVADPSRARDDPGAKRTSRGPQGSADHGEVSGHRGWRPHQCTPGAGRKQCPAHRGHGCRTSTSPDGARATSQPLPREVAQVVRPWIDFEHLKSQLPLQHVLEHLDVLATLRGGVSQRRGPCPVHAKNGQKKGGTFSVQLDNNVFQCFDPKCGIKGDVIDLYAVMKGLNLREAAVELVTLFNLEPAPRTEKRHG